MASINWIDTSKDDTSSNDVKDAINFMSLVKKKKKAAKLIDNLTQRPVVHFKAKDILRAAQLQPAAPDDPNVAEKLAMINAGTPIPPVLLLRGDTKANRPLMIADGYHRVSAAFHLDPTTDVQAQIIHP